MATIGKVALGLWTSGLDIIRVAEHLPQVSSSFRFVTGTQDIGDGEAVFGGEVVRIDLFTGTKLNVTGGPQDKKQEGNASISGNGRYVAFDTPQHVFRKDFTTGELVNVSTNASGTPGNKSSSDPELSSNGRFVVFGSTASNLVVRDTNAKSDIFRKDLITDSILRVSTTHGGAQANGPSEDADVSGNGRYVVFTSRASNLVARDTNGKADIFRKDLATGEIVRVSTSVGGVQANGHSSAAEVSFNGRFVTFQSDAGNLVAGDTNGVGDLFRKDLVTGKVIRLAEPSNIAFSHGGLYKAESLQQDGDHWRITVTNTTTNTRAVSSQFFSADPFFTGAGGVTPLKVSPDGRFVLFESFGTTVEGHLPFSVYQVVDTKLSRVAPSMDAAAPFNRDVFLKVRTDDATRVSVDWGDGKASSEIPASDGSTDLARLLHGYQRDGIFKVTITAFGGVADKEIYRVIIKTITPAGRHEQSISGTSGHDIVLGSAIRDVVNLGAGDDIARTSGGGDIVKGGAGDDALFGLAGNDVLDGGGGKDTLDGGEGKDVLVGGLGQDTLIGGFDADRFDFNAVSESPRGSRDTVRFNHAEHDKIDLRTIDADTDGTAGNQAFKWIGAAAFHGIDGELRFSRGVLQGDVNGDGIADFELRVIGALSSADIIL